MKYLFKSLKQVIDLFNCNSILWATEISEKLWKSRVTVHKYLKALVEEWSLVKTWVWPTVKYKLSKKLYNICEEEKENRDDEGKQIFISYNDKKLLDEIFLKFRADWKILKWFEWIKNWCNDRNLDLKEKIKLYIDVYSHIKKNQNECWLIKVDEVFWKDFDKVYLNDVYYADQYKWMEFWRWKLAELTFYWKSSQNKDLINESIWEIIYKLECIISKEKYDAIAITPWSIDRKNQLLKILKKALEQIWLPFVNIIKYYPNGIAIPQKSLKTRQQRIFNAQNTIFVDDKNIEKYKKVFLIDDFVWSWATLNETAKKLKNKWVKKVDWFAFVWNMNLSYDVISEI